MSNREIIYTDITDIPFESELGGQGGSGQGGSGVKKAIEKIEVNETDKTLTFTYTDGTKKVINTKDLTPIKTTQSTDPADETDDTVPSSNAVAEVLKDLLDTITAKIYYDITNGKFVIANKDNKKIDDVYFNAVTGFDVTDEDVIEVYRSKDGSEFNIKKSDLIPIVKSNKIPDTDYSKTSDNKVLSLKAVLAKMGVYMRYNSNNGTLEMLRNDRSVLSTSPFRAFNRVVDLPNDKKVRFEFTQRGQYQDIDKSIFVNTSKSIHSIAGSSLNEDSFMNEKMIMTAIGTSFERLFPNPIIDNDIKLGTSNYYFAQFPNLRGFEGYIPSTRSKLGYPVSLQADSGSQLNKRIYGVDTARADIHYVNPIGNDPTHALLSYGGFSAYKKSFCISIWLQKKLDFQNERQYIWGGGSNQNQEYASLSIGWESADKFRIDLGGGHYTRITHSFKPYGEWHQYILHFDASIKQAHLYVDGDHVGGAVFGDVYKGDIKYIGRGYENNNKTNLSTHKWAWPTFLIGTEEGKPIFKSDWDRNLYFLILYTNQAYAMGVKDFNLNSKIIS